jgi:hypothetical protein
MRVQLETSKFQIIQWLMGLATGGGALLLGMGSGNGTNYSLYATTYMRTYILHCNLRCYLHN